MFSIIQKSQETVNADDLEQLQNQLEHRLVEIVTQRWQLERELSILNSTSPDSTSNQTILLSAINGAGKNALPNVTNNLTTNHQASLPSGKLRNSMKTSQIEPPELTSDGFLTNGANGGHSGANSNETDSVSSDGSSVSNLTSSTIITAAQFELGSQNQITNLISNKRSLKNSSNDRPSKRFRQESSNSLRSSVNSYAKRPPHSKHRPKVVPSKYRNSLEESRPNKKQTLKNEAPDKLWPFVEQFCATPTEDQMKELEKMIQSMENDTEYYKVPTLGKKDNSSKDSPSKSDKANSAPKNSRKSRSKNEEEASLGALTQRGVSILLEETDDVGTELSKSSSDSSSPPAKKRRSKASKGLDANNLEKRIRQQLEEYSILSQQDDIPFGSEEDDTLRELLAYQHELLSIQTQNKLHMQVLLKRAKKHAELEREREKLSEANNDVINAYIRLIQAKQRKRNPSKKEKDMAWRALKVHETIFKTCDDIYMSSLDRNI